jgi:transcriptional regulator with XRE-family HTH domain
VALKVAMAERRLSYRQLAYKTQLSAGYLNHLTKGTRPVPADAVISVIAAALVLEPDYFLEYRLRQVAKVLGESTRLVDSLYEILLLDGPVPDDLRALLDEEPNGNGKEEPERSAAGF